MRKDIPVLFLFIIFVCVSCENKVSTQSYNASNTQPVPTSVSKEKPSSEFLIHYHEGLKIKVNGKFPDDVPKAIEEFKKAAEINPADKETYRRIAELYVSINKYEEAATYYRKIIKLDSNDGYAQWALAQLLVENLGKYREGLQKIDVSEKLYGNDGLSYVRARLKGKAYDGLGEYESAIKYYQIFLKGSASPDADDYKQVGKRISELKSLSKNDLK